MKSEEEKNIETEPTETENLEDTDALFPYPQQNPVLDYDDIVTETDPTNTMVSGCGKATVNLDENYKIQLFKEKTSHFQSIGNNDFLGFTLVFGNTSSRAYIPGKKADPTLIDELDLSDLDKSIQLTLVDLCIPECYKLVVTDDKSIDPCDKYSNNIFKGGKKYRLTLKKCTECNKSWGSNKKTCKTWSDKFPIPCQSICCISMLFRIDPADPCNCEPHCCLEDI